MKRLATLLILTIVTVNSWAQSREEQEKDYIQLVWDSNMPDGLYAFFKQEDIKTNYEINKNLNPFYLRGDFNGDKKIDYALAVIELKTGKKGILIYHPATKIAVILGAGKKISNGYNSDDMNWMDAWHVYDKKEIGQGATAEKPPKLIGEAIYADKLESSSGLIYWNGKEYRWYQQGD